MPNIMAPIQPIGPKRSLLKHWAMILGTLGGPGRPRAVFDMAGPWTVLRMRPHPNRMRQLLCYLACKDCGLF